MQNAVENCIDLVDMAFVRNVERRLASLHLLLLDVEDVYVSRRGARESSCIGEGMEFSSSCGGGEACKSLLSEH